MRNFLKYKIYYIVGIFAIVAVAVVAAIFLTSQQKGSVIDIAIPSKESIFKRTSNIILGPNTSQNLYFHKSGWFMKKIEFRLPESSNGDYQIKALITTSGNKPREEDWTNIDRKIFCLNKRDEKFKDIVLTITNNSASSTMKEEVQVYAMRDGCDEWSGTFKYEWQDTNSKKNEQGVLQAVFTLKENAYATEYDISDGGYSFNLLGCSKEIQTKTYTMISDNVLSGKSISLLATGDGGYKLKLPLVWGKTDKTKEYIKSKNVCIYGKETGDAVGTLGEVTIKTLDEVMKEDWTFTPDVVSGNIKGSREISAVLEDGTERKIQASWNFVRQ